MVKGKRRLSGLIATLVGVVMLLAVGGVAFAASGSASTLSFDGGATGGGGGTQNATALAYCWVVDGGSLFELNREVDSPLVTTTAGMNKYVGVLASSWDFNGNNLIFHLRQNAQWSDGVPLTAKDVLFTFNAVANPKTGSRYATVFANVEGDKAVTSGTAQTLSGVTAPNPYTVIVHFTQPDSAFLPSLSLMDIMPQHILYKQPLDNICGASNWIHQRVGSGPYIWVHRVPGQRIELKANPHYFLGAPKIKQINLLFFSSYETSLAAFEQQSSMVAPLTANNLKQAESLSFAHIVKTPAGVGSIFINEHHKAFANLKVREAISYAINRAAITKALFQGTAVPAWSEMPWLKWTQAADLNHYNYNPALAKKLLKEAGWNSTNTYTLWYYYPDQVTASVMQAVQQYLGAVGIKVQPRLNVGGALAASEANGTWDLIYGSYGAQTYPSVLSAIWGCSQQKQWSYCNPKFDQAMAKAQDTFNHQLQAKYYQQAIKILNHDLPWVWLFNRQNLIVVNNKIDFHGNTAWGPAQLLYHNYIENWTLKP